MFSNLADLSSELKNFLANKWAIQKKSSEFRSCRRPKKLLLQSLIRAMGEAAQIRQCSAGFAGAQKAQKKTRVSFLASAQEV